MKINLSPNDRKKVENLISMLDTNIENAQYVIEFIQKHSKSINKTVLDKQPLPIETAYELFMRKKLKLPVRVEQICKVHVLNPLIYKNNPYYQRIHLNTVKASSWKIENQPYLPYEGFIAFDLSVDESNYFKEIYHVGIFKESFSYLNLSQDEVTWMSITPNEIETMKLALSQVKGKVVTFGLGLGYFAYMASIKQEVEEITIVEIDTSIIDLFTKHILPQFPIPNKIKIVKSDAFDYLKNVMATQEFDYAFIDTWHTVDDGFPLFLQFKSFESNFNHCTFLYWLNDSMIAMLRRYVIMLIREQLEGWTSKDYQNPKSDGDIIFHHLFYLLENYPIQSFKDIMILLSENHLKELLLKMF